MQRVLLTVLFVLSSIPIVPAQLTDSAPDALPAFDAASVKRNILPDFTQRANYRFTPGRFSARNLTLRELSRVAFSTVTDAQLVGGPDWFDSTKFDIDATRPGASKEELRLALRRLLLHRFSLVARFEMRTLPVYKLVRSGRGDLPKELKVTRCGSDTEKGDSTCGTFAFGANALIGNSVAMAAFSKLIAEYPDYTNIDRLVVDETGLTDNYSFTIRYSPERQLYGLRSAPNPDLPTFSTALREQLGLKLQAGTQPTQVVVIERASLPSAD